MDTDAGRPLARPARRGSSRTLAGQLKLANMATIEEMKVSLEDTRWFDAKINEIVRGPEHTHDLEIIRRYFRGYLHCWKTVLHFVREAKAFKDKHDWVAWSQRWQETHLGVAERQIMDQLRDTRDYDTHSGVLTISGEVAMGLFPLVFLGPVGPSHFRQELVTCTARGVTILERIIATHATSS